MTLLKEQGRCWVMPWRGSSLEQVRREALGTQGFS